MSNPEFKRNLWLSFSKHRLIGMPSLLALTFLAIAFADTGRGRREPVHRRHLAVRIHRLVVGCTQRQFQHRG